MLYWEVYKYRVQVTSFPVSESDTGAQCLPNPPERQQPADSGRCANLENFLAALNYLGLTHSGNPWQALNLELLLVIVFLMASFCVQLRPLYLVAT